ncbi:retrovirus-related pol polyprotein from transposon TNT 1-94 [Tanacetum coccineum]|uniref:Retrovirus-related pol polyprotein from transposon TNT 1-94 n=1 Tax=Tanacetum coccineum TaxID=301880 RepID=A0ABQ4X9U2_9ASTR
MELDLEARLMGETLVINRSLDPLNGDYIELNDLNEPFELRRNQGDDLMPTIEEGEVIEEFRTRDDELDTGIDDYPSYCDYDKKIHIDCAHNLKFSCMIGFEFTHVNFFPLLYVNVMSKKFHNSIMKDKMVYKGNNVIGALMNVPIFVGTFSVVTDFAVLENMDAYRDEGMGDVIFGEPFLREVRIKTRRFEGMIIIYNGNDEVTYQMVRSHPRFKQHTNEQCNKISPLLKIDLQDQTRLMDLSNPKSYSVRQDVSQHPSLRPIGDYVIGDSVILGHNLFSVRQFCDSDLEVAFRKHSCYVRDTDGVELIKGSRGSDLYTISVEYMMKSSPICLLSKSSKNKSWLWHRHLNHLNFGTINDLARKDLVRGLPRLKFEKYHLCSACQLGKSKKHTHTPKAENTNLEVLNTLHMDLCGPMRVQTINGKKYILVIVDDYSRTPQQKDVVERRNRTLLEAARTMLIFSKAPMFLWAEVVAIACYTQNCSLIHTRHNKTPYELVHDKKHDLTFFRVFGALCYLINDSEDLGKLQPTADIGIFIGYAPSRKGYRIYNKRTQKIMETIHVQFDVMSEPMAHV